MSQSDAVGQFNGQIPAAPHVRINTHLIARSTWLNVKPKIHSMSLHVLLHAAASVIAQCMARRDLEWELQQPDKGDCHNNRMLHTQYMVRLLWTVLSESW